MILFRFGTRQFRIRTYSDLRHETSKSKLYVELIFKKKKSGSDDITAESGNKHL